MNPSTDHVHHQRRSSSTLSLKFTGNSKLKQVAEEEDMREEEEELFEEDGVETDEDDEFEEVVRVKEEGRGMDEEMIQLKKKRIDLDRGIWSSGNKKSTIASSAAGSGGAASAPPPLICKVEKCRADLTDCKKYHKRHRVCEYHAKVQVAIVDGLKQRFCQQCSRFHELPEFDDTKRSCRRRLEGHNARRRKISMESRGEGLDHGGSRLADKKDQSRLIQERGRGQMVFPKNHRNLHIHS